MSENLLVRKRFNLLETAAKIYCFFILTIFPIWVDSNGYSAITECKFKTFWITMVLYFAISVGIIIYYTFAKKGQTTIMAIRRHDMPVKFTIPQILTIVFVVWNIISSILSEYGKKTWMGFGRYEGLFSAILYGVLFIMLSFWAEYSRSYQKGIACSVVIFLLFGFLQFFCDGVIYPQGYTFWEARFVSTIGNVDMIGGYIAIFVPILFVTYILDGEKVWDYIYLVEIALLTFIFVISDVDSGKIGLAVGLVFCLPFILDTVDHIKRTLYATSAFTFGWFLERWCNLSKEGFNFTMDKKTAVLLIGAIVLASLGFALKFFKVKINLSRKQMRKLILIGMLVAAVFVVVFLFFYKGDNVLLFEVSEVLHFRLGDNAGSGRGHIWKTSWMLAQKKFFFGYGPGSFGEVFHPYDWSVTYTDFAHNDFLQIAVCVGLCGLFIYCAFCISLAVSALKRAPKSKQIVIFGTACASYLAHSFFSFSIGILSPFFWVIAGIVDKLCRQVEDIKEE